jgi:nicotinamide-nucleotide amidase
MDIRRAAVTLGSMSATQIFDRAETLLKETKARGYTIATAESCTGGLIAASLAAVPGASDSLDRGFVTYSNKAKNEMLGVPMALIDAHGAVSREVALAMVAGALANSPADIAVAVTGVAGPGGGTATKPVGLVHIAAARRGGGTLHDEKRFGAIGRHEIQTETVAAAFDLMTRVLD